MHGQLSLNYWPNLTKVKRRGIQLQYMHRWEELENLPLGYILPSMVKV